MKKILFIFLLLYSFNVVSQSVVTTTGSTASGSGEATISIGQISYVGNSSTTVGVQQPREVIIISVSCENEVNDIKVAPNPAVTSFEVMTDHEVTLNLYDASWKQVLSTSEKVVNVENLASGTYFLTITENEIKIKTYKLVKQ